MTAPTYLNTRAADMLEGMTERGMRNSEIYALIAELRAAAQQSALDELVRENERLGLYDDQKPNAHELPAMPQAFADYMTKQMPPDTVISDPQWWARRIWRTAMRLHAAPAPAQPRQPYSDLVSDGGMDPRNTQDQPRQPLSDADLYAMWDNMRMKGYPNSLRGHAAAFARQVEAAHGIGAITGEKP